LNVARIAAISASFRIDASPIVVPSAPDFALITLPEGSTSIETTIIPSSFLSYLGSGIFPDRLRPLRL